MIKYDYTVTVTGNTAKLDKDIYLFRGNKNVHYYFAIKNASFNFKGTTDLIEKTNAINAAVTVVKPNAVEVANAIAPVENGKIHLKVTEDLIDEEVEVGDFDLVFDLFDDTDGAVTIPKVIGQFHVLERPCTTPISELVATNTTNEVDQALTDYAIVTYAEPVASTNADGTFAKKTWVPKEKITTAELNRIEEGIFKNSSQIKDIANEIKQGKNSLINQNGGGTLKIWAGTQTELDALTSKNSDTLYFIINEESTGGEGTAYTITNTLTNCTNSNIASNIEKNSSYIATISANAGYTLGDVIVTMGGIDITNSSYSNGTINITSVTGNITIVANAELSSTGDKYLTCLSSTALDQYIDTGYTLSSEDEIEVKYSVPFGTVSQEHVIIGARDSWKVNDITLNKNSSGVFGTKTFSGKDSLIYGTTIVIFKVKNGEQSINKTVVANISDTFTCNYSAYIFALNNAGEPYKYSNINLYYLKISKNGVLMKDYRPYIKDGVACLKEEVSGEYLYNLGKESFTYTE